MEIIANRRIWAVRPATSAVFQIDVQIGRPYEVSTDEWACPVQLIGLHKLRDTHGGDSFQALMLAQNLARTLLAALVEEGGKLIDSPGGEAIDSAACSRQVRAGRQSRQALRPESNIVQTIANAARTGAPDLSGRWRMPVDVSGG